MKPYLLALGLGVACIFMVPKVHAQTVRIPGTRVTLESPPGFSLAQQFPGLQRAELGASIMITEIPAPYTKMKDGINAEGLASRGISVTAVETVSVAGREGVLMAGRQTAQGVVFEKWMLLFGDAQNSVMVMATFPLEVADQLSDQMRAAVVSSQWAPNFEVGVFEGLVFRVEPTDKLHISSRVSNLLLLAKPGHKGVVPPQDPFMVVGTSLSEVAIDDVESFARARLKQTAQVSDIELQSGRSVSVNGMRGYEVVASAKDARSGEPLLVYQAVLLEQDRYFILQGFVGSERGEEYLAEFRAVTDTLTVQN